MTFAEKLKSIRKKAGLSQEQLAEKLGVSRQAVTKWETETGIPDIENMMAISALFDISIDELLSNERGMKKSNEYLFESVTEYDIDEPKRYDMKFGGAKQFVLSGYEGEKIRVRLVSNTLSTLQNDFKVKIDDIRKRIDVDVIRKNGISEATAKETVSIFVQIPIPYVGKIEGAVNAETVEIRSLDCDSIELDVKTPNIILNDVGGTVEINCNLDMSVVCNSLKGYLAINQVSATSKIHIPEGEVFTAVTKGIGTSISYEKDGRQTERFDTPDAENVIELNGSASATAETRFTALGAEVCMLSAEPDGTNINDHCGSTHMEQLMAYVPAHGCQLGLAFDGDADRCLAVDETGKVVDGDQMIAICAKALKASGKLEKDTAVVTVMTNLGFFHFTKREGIHTIATKVGDRYVLEEMKKGGYCIGGEQSGHIIFLEHATTGDGELSGAKLVEIVKQSGKKLSELAGEMETFPQQMQNVRITADQRNRWKEDEAVCSVMKQYEERLGEDGRILVRESGTEPLIRVMVEAKDADLMQEAVSAIAEELERYTKR